MIERRTPEHSYVLETFFSAVVGFYSFTGIVTVLSLSHEQAYDLVRKDAYFGRNLRRLSVIAALIPQVPVASILRFYF